MRPHFELRSGVRHFKHAGPARLPRLLDCEVACSQELRVELASGSQVAESLLAVLERCRYQSAVGRVLWGSACALAYHRMVTTSDSQRPYDYGKPVELTGPVTFISGALTVGRDATGAPLLHCHAGMLDSLGQQHGGHLVLQRVVVGSEPLVLRLCLFEHVAYQVQPDTETHFNLLHPVIKEAS